ncbi:Acetate transporter GPR1/FUN34/SatP [Gracilaria domingensis]|nr:Acetate transporter GPR1/FUN34/SatP [Gracilaria domingensis]
MSTLSSTSPRTSYEKLLPTIAKRLDTLEKALLPLPVTTKSFRPIANPAPLGLLGFAAVSILAAIPKLEDRAKNTSQLIFVVAFFLGGLAQVIAALLEFTCNHLHAASTFALFGLHWSAQAILILSKTLSFSSFTPIDSHDAAVYYTILTVATVMLFVPSLRMNRVLSVALFFVIFAFGFDVPAAFGHHWAEVGSGVAAIAASILAMYMAFVEFVNEAWDKQLLSVFPVDTKN